VTDYRKPRCVVCGDERWNVICPTCWAWAQRILTKWRIFGNRKWYRDVRW
jgi:hypothetical protein